MYIDRRSQKIGHSLFFAFFPQPSTIEKFIDGSSHGQKQHIVVVVHKKNEIRIHTVYNYNNLKFSADVTVHRRCCFLRKNTQRKMHTHRERSRSAFFFFFFLSPFHSSSTSESIIFIISLLRNDATRKIRMQHPKTPSPSCDSIHSFKFLDLFFFFSSTLFPFLKNLQRSNKKRQQSNEKKQKQKKMLFGF